MSTSLSIKAFYKPKEKYLFLGNGINLLSKDLSWETLLQRVSDSAKVKIDFGGKTYPLIFEEIAYKFRIKSPVEHNLSYLKKIVAKECSKFSPNEFHEKIIGSNKYKHFLTTNYDYCIENAIDKNFDPAQNKNQKNSKHSLHRFNNVAGKKVWHMHGEIDNGLRGEKISSSESILIGNEHYGDYQRRIHELIKSSSGKALNKLMQTEEENWVHLFFSRDIDIVGFGMDFNETHLWWLLNFRARMMRKGASVANTISFFYPSFSAPKLKPKLDLLKILNVKLVPVNAPERDYEKFYGNFCGRKKI